MHDLVGLLPRAVIERKAGEHAQSLLKQVGVLRAQADRARNHAAALFERHQVVLGFEQQLERARGVLRLDELLAQTRAALDFVRNVDGRVDEVGVVAVRRQNEIIVVARNAEADRLLIYRVQQRLRVLVFRRDRDFRVVNRPSFAGAPAPSGRRA